MSTVEGQDIEDHGPMEQRVYYSGCPMNAIWHILLDSSTSPQCRRRRVLLERAVDTVHAQVVNLPRLEKQRLMAMRLSSHVFLCVHDSHSVTPWV